MKLDEPFKVIYYCQRCKTPHDRTNESMFETGVRCSECNGFVITPSGRALMQIVFTKSIFVVIGDNYTSWIAADKSEDAAKLFERQVDGWIYRIIKLTDVQMQKLLFKFWLSEEAKDKVDESQLLYEDGKPYSYVNGKDILTLIDDFPEIILTLDNECIADNLNDIGFSFPGDEL